MAKKKKISIAFKGYDPKSRTWECYNTSKDKLVKLGDFSAVLMKNTKKFKPLYIKDDQLDGFKKAHPDLKTWRVYHFKDEAYQHVKDRSIRHEIAHPFTNNGLFIDCLLNYQSDIYCEDLAILDAPDIQAIAKGLLKIFKYTHLNKRVDPIVNDLINKKISFKNAQYKIEQVISGRSIRYIPYGSPLQKALTKAFKNVHYTYRQVFGGCDSNMFGFFYLEPTDHNIIQDILEKEGN